MNSLDSLSLYVKCIDIYEYGSEQYNNALVNLATGITGKLCDSLNQLVLCGPVHDEDIIAPSLRDELIKLKLAVRVVDNGREGYTCATYLGGRVHKVILENKKRPVVTINISGPTQTGKTIIANEIATMLQKNFGCSVMLSGDLSLEDAGTPNYHYSQWELDMLKKNIWKIEEEGLTK